MTDSMLDSVIVPTTRELGDGFEVRRALPAAGRRMVGPFVFFDQFGPTILSPGRGLDVRPHPHIGLSTLTWLLQGEIVHRDSLGTQQPIRAGEVNWMTAGSGIVHSERSDIAQRTSHASLFGLQCWIALPRAHEETAPDFTHLKAKDLPVLEGEGVKASIIAGSFFGLTSSVPTFSPMFYVELRLQPGARIALPALYVEQAIYVVEGQLDLGLDGLFDAGQLLVTRTATEAVLTAGAKGAIVMLLGGEPLDGPRYLSWNFVSSSQQRIEQAKQDWLQQRFASVAGDPEFIPLPESLMPADYP